MAHKLKKAADTIPKDEPVKRVLIPMPDAMHHRLRIIAAEQRTTMAKLITDAIERTVLAK